MAKLMSKSELIQKIAEQHSNNMTRKDVKAVIELLATIGYKELNKSGAFLVPGFAKFVVIKKPATKERSGINPFTKEPTIFQGEAGSKDRQGSAGKGCQRRSIVASVIWTSAVVMSAFARSGRVVDLGSSVPTSR